MSSTTSSLLASRCREVLLDGTWIANTNFIHQIEQVTWRQATRRISDLNSIALLTFHIDYYVGGVLQVLQGGELTIRDKYSFDMPSIESEEDWQSLKERFRANASEMVTAISALNEEELDAGFVKEEYGSYRRNIDGIIEHAYYHLGQVSLIRKLIERE